MTYNRIKIYGNLKEDYSDVFTSEALSAISSLAHFNKDIKEVMGSRLRRRSLRHEQKKRIVTIQVSKIDKKSSIP
ncbi:hypothetical protein BH23BAC2_BH23BAC2_13750 [soil metagenome]